MEKIKRTQVYLDCDLHKKLKREALEKGISMSSILRSILKEYFYPSRKRHRRKRDIRDLIGLFKDPATNVARHHDDYLAGTENEDLH